MVIFRGASIALLVLLFTTISENASAGIKSTSTNLIASTCSQTRYFHVCMSSFWSNPRSYRSDIHGLADILINTTIDHAMETISHINKLRMSVQNSSRYASWCLRDCADEYDQALDDLRQSREAFVQRTSHETVNIMLSGAMASVDSCQTGCEEAGVVVEGSLLRERNGYFAKLCSNSLAITNLLAL